MKINDLQTRLAEVYTRQEEILALSDAESRDFTEEETTEFDKLTAESTNIKKQIAVEQRKDEARTEIAMRKISTGQAKKSEETKATERFSLIRTINNMAKGITPDNMDGIEGELHQEAIREAREHGRGVQGFGLPSFMVRAGQDAATAATAGNLIETSLGSFFDALRPKTVVSSLGAVTMTGLVGNVDLPGGDTLATATWEGETDANANTDPSTKLVNLRPNRLAAKTSLSKQLLIQSSVSAEQWVRSELENAVARAVDTAAITGNGGNIDGILGTSGVTDITFGGAVTRNKIVDLMTAIATENADMGSLGFLMHPVIKGSLMKLAADAGSGLFVMGNQNSLFGYNTGVSTLVPTDIAGSKTAVIFGDWSNLILANWGGLDITVDPYTLADNAQVKVVINSFWDVKIKHAKAFAFGNDLTWTALS